jgi:hypothetical protein
MGDDLRCGSHLVRFSLPFPHSPLLRVGTLFFCSLTRVYKYSIFKAGTVSVALRSLAVEIARQPVHCPSVSVGSVCESMD